jgi:hypothetical protein
MAQTKDNVATFDYIVFGGINSCAVVARHLTENNANFSVCLRVDERWVGKIFSLVSHSPILASNLFLLEIYLDK